MGFYAQLCRTRIRNGPKEKQKLREERCWGFKYIILKFGISLYDIYIIIMLLINES